MYFDHQEHFSPPPSKGFSIQAILFSHPWTMKKWISQPVFSLARYISSSLTLLLPYGGDVPPPTPQQVTTRLTPEPPHVNLTRVFWFHICATKNPSCHLNGLNRERKHRWCTDRATPSVPLKTTSLHRRTSAKKVSTMLSIFEQTLTSL